MHFGIVEKSSRSCMLTPPRNVNIKIIFIWFIGTTINNNKRLSICLADSDTYPPPKTISPTAKHEETITTREGERGIGRSGARIMGWQIFGDPDRGRTMDQ